MKSKESDSNKKKRSAGLGGRGQPTSTGDRDIYSTKSWDDDALLQPEPRAAYKKLLKQGWTDSLREMHPDDERLFTFWHYLRKRWERDAGLRLDHILLSPVLAKKLKAAGVDRQVRGREGASDHAPVWIDLK